MGKKISVILLDPLRKLGKSGDVVKIKRGYFKYLEKLHKAEPATKENLDLLELKKEELAVLSAQRYEEAQLLKEKMENLTVHVKEKASETGLLYGSITSRNIEKLLDDQGFRIGSEKICLTHPLKTIGKHPVIIALHPDVSCTITVEVTQEV